MDIASLSIEVNSSSVPTATANLEAMTAASTAAETSAGKLTAKHAPLQSATRMTSTELDALKAAHEKLIVRQDAFLQSMDKQAATLGMGTAALRAYKAEQLGLTDNKTFTNLNKQITDLEQSGPSAIDKMATRMEGRIGTMVLRMGVHMVLVTAVIGSIVGLYHMLTDADTKLKDDQKSAWNSVADEIQKALDKVDEYNTKIRLSTGVNAGIKAYDWEATVAHGQAANAYAEKLRLNTKIGSSKFGDSEYTDSLITERDRQQAIIGEALAREKNAVAMGNELFRQASLAQSEAEGEAVREGRDKRMASAADARIKQQAAFLNGLRQEIDLFGAGKDTAREYQAAKLGMAGNSSFTSLDSRLNYLENQKKEQAQADVQAKVDRKNSEDTLGEMLALHEKYELIGADIQTQIRYKLMDKGASEAEIEAMADIVQGIETKTKALQYQHSLEQEAAKLNRPAGDERERVEDMYAKGLIGLDVYIVKMKEVEKHELHLKAESGDTWAIIGDVVARSAGMATDKTVDWMNATNGLARTWKTAGDAIKSILREMVIEMEKAIVKQQLMKPIMDWASNGSNWAALLGTISGQTTMGGDGNMGPQPEIAPSGGSGSTVPAAFRGGSSSGASVSVVVNSNGSTESSVKGGGDMGRGLKAVVDGYIDQWAARESRHGGMLAGKN